MPYADGLTRDLHGRWIPPRDHSEGWEAHAVAWDDFHDAVADGLWADFGLGDLQSIADLYQSPEWEEMNDTQRIDTIVEYQERYWDEDSDDYISNSEKSNQDWGIDIWRVTEDDGGSAADWDGAHQWFDQHYGGAIDWAAYNDDSLFDAARKEMSENYDYFGDNPLNAYDTVQEVRQAQDIINNWSDAEREAALAWAEENVTPYKSSNDSDAQEYFPTRSFDTSSNTTRYYNHLTGSFTGSKTWLPPQPPRSLNIVEGDAPTQSFNANGVRVANEADITGWYRQYLNRTPEADGLAYWLDQSANGMPFENIMHNIMKSQEANQGVDGIVGTADDNRDYGQIYYNPQEYGTPDSITAKMVAAPPKIQAPTLTIRNIGEPRKPTQHYNALNDTVWTDPSVDTRSANTGQARRDAQFRTEAPIVTHHGSGGS